MRTSRGKFELPLEKNSRPYGEQSMKHVIIIQSVVKQYRVPFFLALRDELRASGIHLTVVYSEPNTAEGRKKDNVELEASLAVKVPARWFLDQRFVYQRALSQVADADMVIVEQANKHLINPILLLMSKFGTKKIGFWGLGENKQPDRSAISEWLKRRTISKVDWFFAYTRETAHFLKQCGVDSSRITAVQNAVDTRQLSVNVSAISSAEAMSCREALGIPAHAPTALYCGTLEQVKLGCLFQSAEEVRREIHDFHLLIVGDGGEADAVRAFSSGNDWVHWVGPKFGKDNAVYFRIADVFFMPGRVGLAILDAFAAGLPLCTTALPNHGPEIEYLVPEKNGVMTEPGPHAFASALVELLRSPNRLAALKAGARDSGRFYTVENMARNFADGIIKCLGTVQI